MSEISHWLAVMSGTMVVMLFGLVLQLLGTDYIGVIYVSDAAVACTCFVHNVIKEIVEIAVGNCFKMEINDIQQAINTAEASSLLKTSFDSTAKEKMNGYAKWSTQRKNRKRLNS